MTIPNSGIIIGDIFGFLISLLAAPFLAFWVSAVKRKAAVIAGAIIGGIIAFLIIFFWAGTVKDANGASVFFASVFFCTIIGMVAGMLTDLIVARIYNRDYRRQIPLEQ